MLISQKRKVCKEARWYCTRCKDFSEYNMQTLSCKNCRHNPFKENYEVMALYTNSDVKGLYNGRIISKECIYGKVQVSWQHDPTFTSWVDYADIIRIEQISYNKTSDTSDDSILHVGDGVP
eukprot:UN29720